MALREILGGIFSLSDVPCEDRPIVLDQAPFLQWLSIHDVDERARRFIAPEQRASKSLTANTAQTRNLKAQTNSIALHREMFNRPGYHAGLDFIHKGPEV